MEFGHLMRLIRDNCSKAFFFYNLSTNKVTDEGSYRYA